MYKYRLLQFYNRRLQGILHFKDDIKSIKIYPRRDETFGKDYFRVYFEVEFSFEDLNVLSPEKRKILHHGFHNHDSSGGSFISYLEYSHGNQRFSNEKVLVKLKEFYELYTIATTQITLFLQDFLDDKVDLKITSLDSYPEFALVNRFYNKISSLTEYKYLCGSSFREDRNQFEILLRENEKHEAYFKKNPKRSTVSDIEIAKNCYCKISDVRSMILYTLDDIPFKILIKNKVIEKLKIDLDKLYRAIQKIDKDDEGRLKWYGIYKLFLLNYLESKKEELKVHKTSQRKIHKFIKNFPIANNSIALTNDKIFQISSIYYRENSLFFDCLNIKQNLDKGKRTTILKLKDIDRYIGHHEFQSRKSLYGWKYNRQAVRWIKKNGQKEHLKFLQRKKLIPQQ